eukprot:364861-Chlamydomonas_euryale.AAC.7
MERDLAQHVGVVVHHGVVGVELHHHVVLGLLRLRASSSTGGDRTRACEGCNWNASSAWMQLESFQFGSIPTISQFMHVPKAS